MNNFDNIGRFLAGEMPENEAEEFERQIAEDKELALEVEIQRFGVEAIRFWAEKDLRNHIKTLREEEQKESRPQGVIKSIKFRKIYKWVAIAAAFALLILSIFLWQDRFSTDKTVVYGYEIRQPKFDQTGRRKGEVTETVFDPQYIEILTNRDAERAEKAVEYFQSFVLKDSSAALTYAKLNIAHAYVLNKDYEKAITQFTELENAENTNNRLKQEIHYYKALALIGNNDFEKASLLLQQLLGTDYEDDAKKIMDRLDHQ